MTGFFVKITQVNFMAAKYKNNNIRYEQTNRIIEKFLYDLKFQKNIKKGVRQNDLWNYLYCNRNNTYR